jgi:hypothetical protein
MNARLVKLRNEDTLLRITQAIKRQREDDEREIERLEKRLLDAARAPEARSQP